MERTVKFCFTSLPIFFLIFLSPFSSSPHPNFTFTATYCCRAKQVQSKAYADRQRADQTEHLKHLLGLARHFRATQLLVRCGLAPWQRYMEIVR